MAVKKGQVVASYFTDADELFALNRPVQEDVPLPELRKNEDEPVRSVIVRSVPGPDKIALDMKRWDPTKPAGDPERFRAQWFEEERPFELIAACCFRPDGTRLFSSSKVAQLKQLNPKTFARLWAATMRVNGEDAGDLRLSGKAGAVILNGDDGEESLTPLATVP